MKYKLVNTKTGEEHLCQKIVITGFDYYVSGEIQIATNNPNIDIPKVVNEVEELAENETNIRILKHKTPSQIARQYFDGFVNGYKKAQEQFGNSDEDMIKFLDFSKSTNQRKTLYELGCLLKGKPIESSEILKLWKEQKPIKVYYA